MSGWAGGLRSTFGRAVVRITDQEAFNVFSCLCGPGLGLPEPPSDSFMGLTLGEGLTSAQYMEAKVLLKELKHIFMNTSRRITLMEHWIILILLSSVQKACIC